MVGFSFAILFYHSEKLQSTKTSGDADPNLWLFYHSEKLQSTKTANVSLSSEL